jgi:orotidine-5'-phosphate decarboxylase
MPANTQLIVAVDVDTRGEAIGIIEGCTGATWFKIGSQLYARTGPDMVKEVCGMGKQVFLDLKFHDIPNTVAKAAQAAADLGVNLFTLHACGGKRMIAAAREAVEGTQARILTVTVLTSLSDDELRNEVGVPATAAETVPRLAKLAVDAGAHGLVCSPKEIGLVRAAVGPEPVIVTPGVRPVWSSKDDQARVMTPRDAAEAGANFIVVGRPIIKHPNPAEAVEKIIGELAV